MNGDGVREPVKGVGKFKYRDVNGDGAITSADQTYIGSPHPEFNYGVNLNVGYKGFELTGFLQGVYGNDIFNYVRYWTDFNTFQGNRDVRVLNESWIPGRTNATLPILDEKDAVSSRPSSYFIEKGSYARLKNLQLAYNFPQGIATKLPAAVRGLDASLPIVRLQTMDEAFGRSVARPRFLTVLLGVFAVLALVLAAVGTYGILSYLVTERQQEIGIRMALGAARGGVLWLVLRQGLVLAVVGLTLGVTGAILVGRYIQTLLFGVSPGDPATIIMVGGVILMTATVACLIPALRATRVNPLDVLRGD
jgi:hypothetical protein